MHRRDPLRGHQILPRLRAPQRPQPGILDVSWCAEHVPAHQGTEDSIVIAQQYMSGSAEAGADGDNKRMCSLIHRGINLESTHE